VDVDHAEARDGEDLGAEDMPVRDHHAEIEVKMPQPGDEDVADRTLGLKDGEMVLEGDLLDWWRHQGGTGAAMRAVGTGDYRRDVDAAAEQLPQDGTANAGVPKNATRITPAARTPAVPL
jgi:hypothetical protein